MTAAGYRLHDLTYGNQLDFLVGKVRNRRFKTRNQTNENNPAKSRFC